MAVFKCLVGDGIPMHSDYGTCPRGEGGYQIYLIYGDKSANTTFDATVPVEAVKASR
jgi:hypothetical protein